ncbi:MAG: hypothetical protein HC911_01935 [Chloroflexaceae bacterium]|nr:hypothetical protein [Chloroflexaceae bacterium]
MHISVAPVHLYLWSASPPSVQSCTLLSETCFVAPDGLFATLAAVVLLLFCAALTSIGTYVSYADALELPPEDKFYMPTVLLSPNFGTALFVTPALLLLWNLLQRMAVTLPVLYTVIGAVVLGLALFIGTAQYLTGVSPRDPDVPLPVGLGNVLGRALGGSVIPMLVVVFLSTRHISAAPLHTIRFNTEQIFALTVFGVLYGLGGASVVFWLVYLLLEGFTRARSAMLALAAGAATLPLREGFGALVVGILLGSVLDALLSLVAIPVQLTLPIPTATVALLVPLLLGVFGLVLALQLSLALGLLVGLGIYLHARHRQRMSLPLADVAPTQHETQAVP